MPLWGGGFVLQGQGEILSLLERVAIDGRLERSTREDVDGS